jgi:NAD(P)H-dependent flavin oxidoreductase YrpB (nitropropane dioxygenase family)
VLNRLNLSDLDVPVIVAPMAGGPSTPELVTKPRAIHKF